MHPYFSHLLQDIQDAHKEESFPNPIDKSDIEEHFQEIDQWLSGDAAHTLGYYCGLSPEDFPPSNDFSDEEIKHICEAFEKMLASWGGIHDTPNNFPIREKYSLIIGLLEEDFTPINGGVYVFDWCTGYAPDCRLGVYCRCLEFWKEDQ
ncbi:hypothetical protein [Echinicola rosea]|uniref:Uncharacterized protein n=1 Tax=Echinicola rosea TaxID=1807691 RepID=A0ABQ1V7P5_9BACT|nr:hypothetical protein [Echinicola rosea]GGF40602.1 hypothetical protein GCM10011339_31470 [Echinicola rosea]